MVQYSIQLPIKYARRLASDGAGDIRVYGDINHQMYLGTVHELSQALALLDGYDKNFARRQVLADKIDARRADELRKWEGNTDD